MAKQRLVDFRGGLNNKISGHMIGETQGQNMQDVDLSLVRLDGREQINDGDVALGSFFYEPGNLADALFTGRWVSIYSADDDGTSNTPYLPYSTDFVVWNKDLYVAFGPGHSDGQIRVYRDGATAAEIIDFAAPGTTEVSTVNATATSQTLSTAETLVAFVTGQAGTNPQTVTVTTANASQFNPPYVQGNYNTARGRYEWSNGTGTYYDNIVPVNGAYTIQQATGGSAGYTVTLSLSTVSQFDPIYQSAGTFNDYSNRPYAGIANFTFNLYTRNNITYYYAPSSNSTLGVSGGSFYTLSSTGSSSTTDAWTAEQMQLANSDGTVTMYGNYVAYTAINLYENYTNNSRTVTVWVNPPGGTYGDFNTVYSDSVTYSSQSAFESAYSSSGNRSTFTGTDGNVYRRAGAYRAFVTNQYFSLLYYGLQQRTGTTTTYTNNTYSVHNYSQSFAATYTYSNITDTIPSTPTIPDTPAFTYDDARSKLYLEYASTNDVGAEPADSARGANWLAQNRAFSLTDHGYYLRTVRESTNLPQLSSNYTKADLATNNTFVLDSNYSFVNTPQRLNFTIALPSDHNTTDSNGNTLNSVTPLVGFKLERRDNTATVDLGYIAPEAVFASLQSRTAVGFSYSTSTNQVTLSNLEASAEYRIKFQAYQDTYVQVGGNAAAKINTTGISWGDGNSTGASAVPTITLIAQTATTPNPGAGKRYLAADFWLEKKIIVGADNSSDSDDVYATIRCFDLFDRNGNAVNTGVIAGTSDYLDVFATGTSSGSGLSTNSQTGVPNYLTMLEEANNFFFAVGSDNTAPNRYGTSAVNKSDSFLFVSEYNNPRNWPLTGYVEFEGSITGMHSYPGELIVWTGFGVYRVTGSRYDQMRKSKLATTEGLPKGQHRTIAQVGQYLVWVSQSGICAYNGEAVINITRGRLGNLGLGTGSQLHAAQFEDVYYVVDDTETGYAVDFSLTGFPITRIDLKEGATGGISNNALTPAQIRPPVLVYRSSVNQLYSRRGVIQGSSTRNAFTYKTREFDGGAYGSLKLVRHVTVNGAGNGTVQIYLDGKPVFYNNATPPVATPVTVAIESGNRSEPARVYLPTTNTANTMYGLPVADTWSVELAWDGQIDWIDTEYEVLSA
jgi:hypothetical protein